MPILEKEVELPFILVFFFLVFFLCVCVLNNSKSLKGAVFIVVVLFAILNKMPK